MAGLIMVSTFGCNSGLILSGGRLFYAMAQDGLFFKKAGELNASVKRVLAEYIALGLDPEKCTVYYQSDVPETAELYLFLNMNAYLGELERVTSFKEKARTQPNNINAGLGFQRDMER